MGREIQFDEFCKNLGFASYPFNSFTAENERDRQPELFVSTKLYSPLREAFEAGSTMLLTGDRGTGKTSIILDFMRRTKSDHLICQIDDYRPLKKDYSQSDFYKFILESMVNSLFAKLPNVRSLTKKFTEEEKLLLTYFYVHFAADATRGLAKRTARDIQISGMKRFIQGAYNLLRIPLNVATNVGVGIISDVVARSAGTVSDISAEVKEYFPELASGIESEFPDQKNTLEAMRRFASLVRKSGFSRIIVILDKLDEDSRLDNAAEDIADFISPILTDNAFLLDESFQIIVSLWVVPLNFIRDKVRTQKVYSPEVVWEHADLRQVYDKRVRVFSGGESLDFSNTFNMDVVDKTKGRILDLSNKNPRDLWHLMNRIFRAQYDIDAESRGISNAAIEKGMTEFVQHFNFYEYYPRKANSRANSMDVYSFIRHLIKLESTIFTRNQLNERAGTGSSTQNYVVGMESLGLIEKDASEKGEAKYRIRDPKIRFALEHKVDIIRV